MRKKVWLKRIAVTAALAFILFAFGWVPYFLAGIATTRRFQFPDKENAGLTPASFQLAFEDVAFRSADGVDLKGWWVPAPGAKGTVVMVHGLNRSRIEMVRRAPFVHQAGWNALLVDLRHHGASGGETTTFGVKEKEDVEAAVRLARERSPGPVVVWGVSLGAASVVLAAAEDPEVRRRHLRQQLPLARRHGPAPPAAVPRLPVVAAHRAQLAGGGPGPLLDGPAGRLRHRGRGRAGRRGPT